MADALGGAVPGGCTVLAGYVWTPPKWPGRQLRPDVAVHRGREDDLLPTGAPVLCVDIVDGARTDNADPRDSLDLRARRPWQRQQQDYAGLGVDHYWQVDLPRRAVEVFVRDGVGFRHAETLTAAHEWADFGIAVVVLDVPALLATRP